MARTSRHASHGSGRWIRGASKSVASGVDINKRADDALAQRAFVPMREDGRRPRAIASTG